MWQFPGSRKHKYKNKKKENYTICVQLIPETVKMQLPHFELHIDDVHDDNKEMSRGYL